MDSCDDLTITLTLRGREPFTERWMNYMNSVVCPFPILIFDSSEDSETTDRLKDCSNYPNIKYKYIRYPEEKNLGDFFRKLLSIISAVETRFVLQADNDDFFLLHHVDRYIRFLKTNPSFIGVRGRQVNFEVFSKGRSSGVVYGDRYHAYSRMGVDIDDDDPLSRVWKVYENMRASDLYGNWYCIFDKSALLKVLKTVYSDGFGEVILSEALVHGLLAYQGKIKVFDEDFYCRQANTSVFGDTLIERNEFLERSLCNGFVHLDKTLNKFGSLNVSEFMKAYASWLREFLDNLSRNQSRRRSLTYVIYRALMGIRVTSFFAHWLRVRDLSRLKSSSGSVRVVRLSRIEAFITGNYNGRGIKRF